MSRGASAFDVGLRRVRAGEVTTAMLRTDCARGRWLAGIALSHSWGEGSYRGSSEGTVSSTVTGLYPYARYAVSERLSVWRASWMRTPRSPASSRTPTHKV